MKTIAPIQFEPVFKEKLWGGRNLEKKCDKAIPADTAVGESWEISDFGNDLSIAVTPPFVGKTLSRIIRQNSLQILGDLAGRADAFPLLCKFIDANSRLSVQVHPDSRNIPEGMAGCSCKTECWYIVDADIGARIIVGLRDRVTKEDVENAVKNGSLDGLLNYIDIRKGDVLFVPGGTVHAILEGTVIYEVQETSDTTFRLYDWGRIDKNGEARQLHIDEALKCMDTEYHNNHKIAPLVDKCFSEGTHAFRLACSFFVLEEYRIKSNRTVELPQKASFRIIVVLDGSLRFEYENGSLDGIKGQSTLVPAALKQLSVKAESDINILIYSVPNLKNEVINPLKAQGYSDIEISMLGGNPAKNDLVPLLNIK